MTLVPSYGRFSCLELPCKDFPLTGTLISFTFSVSIPEQILYNSTVYEKNPETFVDIGPEMEHLFEVRIQCLVSLCPRFIVTHPLLSVTISTGHCYTVFRVTISTGHCYTVFSVSISTGHCDTVFSSVSPYPRVIVTQCSVSPYPRVIVTQYLVSPYPRVIVTQCSMSPYPRVVARMPYTVFSRWTFMLYILRTSKCPVVENVNRLKGTLVCSILCAKQFMFPRNESYIDRV